jgi:hypothetical protein
MVGIACHALVQTPRRLKVRLTLSYRLSQHMPFRQKVQFLRDRDRRLREMAEHQTPLSDRLKVMAAEPEARADDLPQVQDKPLGDS